MKNMTLISYKIHNILRIPVATPDFLKVKYVENRPYTIRMLWLSAIVALVLWIWDYVHDPVNAFQTWPLRILMGLPPVLCALAMMFMKLPRRVAEWILIISILLSTSSFFAITTYLSDGMISCNDGYMFYQLAVLLLLQGSPISMIFLGHILNTILPHIIAIALPDAGFIHVKYAILLWPVTVAALIAQYYMYVQYGYNWRLRQKLEEMASHDTLTGFLNRRAFVEQATHLVTLAQRHWHQHLSVLMIDADYFKNINDTYGHDTGDAVLRELSDTIRGNLRSTDLQCRWGGEEFIVLLPDTDIEGARRFSERLLESVRGLRIDVAQSEPLTLTVSIGIAELRNNDEKLDSLVSRADSGMYMAKRRGRDRVESAD